MNAIDKYKEKKKKKNDPATLIVVQNMIERKIALIQQRWMNVNTLSIYYIVRKNSEIPKIYLYLYF